MAQRIAVVTGATGGIGTEFVKLLAERSDLDVIWAIGRSKQKLAGLKKQFGDRLRPIACDLADHDQLLKLCGMIEKADVEIRYMVNNAGLARLAKCTDFSTEEITNTIDINCKAVVLLSHAALKRMKPGCRVINVASASSFQPNPYISLYSATKVFVKNYTRAMNFELKGTGITCTAVCPGWVDTAMLPREINGKRVKFPGMVSPKRVAAQALRDADKGRDMSVCSLFVKYEHVAAKLMPNRVIMEIWANEVHRYM